MSKLRIVLNCAPFFRPRARYVFETLLTYYPLDATFEPGEAAFTIYYGDPAAATDDLIGAQGGIIIPYDSNTEAYFTERRAYDPGEVIYWQKIPYLFGAPAPLVNGWYTLPVDSIASAFFFLSAFQEQISEEADEHGRFPGDAMLQRKLGVETIPLVDSYFETLIGLLPAQFRVPRHPLPHDAAFMVCLSHDIDYVFLAHASNPLHQLVTLAGYTWQVLTSKARWALALHALRGFYTYPYFNLHQICQMEKTAGAAATYYFIPAYGVPDKRIKPAQGAWRFLQRLFDPYVYLRLRYKSVNADYYIDDTRIQETLNSLHDAGFEVGLHSSYDAIMDRSLTDEIHTLDQHSHGLWGMRTHYLRFRLPDLYRQLEYTPLVYDHSMLIPQYSGYRTAFSLPHLLFDHENNRPYSTLSIPLHYMDTQHISHMLRTSSVENAWNVLNTLLDQTRASNTLLAVLTHNWLFAQPSTRVLYERLLAYIQAYNGVSMTAQQVYCWWKEHNQVQMPPVKPEPGGCSY